MRTAGRPRTSVRRRRPRRSDEFVSFAERRVSNSPTSLIDDTESARIDAENASGVRKRRLSCQLRSGTARIAQSCRDIAVAPWSVHRCEVSDVCRLGVAARGMKHCSPRRIAAWEKDGFTCERARMSRDNRAGDLSRMRDVTTAGLVTWRISRLRDDAEFLYLARTRVASPRLIRQT